MAGENQNQVLILGNIAHLKGNPFDQSKALEVLEKGALLVDGDGTVADLGPKETLLKNYPEATCRDFGNAWLLPGFIDGHSHFPQLNAIASQAGTLLHWLETQIFPAEIALADPTHAAQLAERFVRRLLGSGTTTAMVYGSQYLHANLSLFEAAEQAGLNLLSGMTLMDRGGPQELLQSPQDAYDHSLQLAQLAETQNCVQYVITPRFALTSSPELLDVCQALASALPDAYIQTHINESLEEIESTARAFPKSADYLGVYEAYGLLRPGAVLAHNIHATNSELKRIAASGTAVCHCPNSNLFLGSGLFPLQRHLDAGVKVLMGTDIGAGLRFSLLEELCEAYKVQKLQGQSLAAEQLLYLATFGAAKALHIDHLVGNFEHGKRADFVILQPARDPYLAQRIAAAPDASAALFCLIMLGNQHILEETHVAGKVVYRNGAPGF